MDTSDSAILLNKEGVCDHCLNFENNIKPNWHVDERGQAKIKSMVEQIKKDGQGKEFDCIIGISGGIDSSYLLYYAKEVLGLRPLAFSVDTGWNLNVAVENIEKIVKGLGLVLYTEIVNWNEMKDLQLAFFKSQVAYQDLPQDSVIFAALYNYATQYKIKHVLTGGNFSTECIREPNEWVYQNDLRMILDIHRKFGKKPLNTLPKASIFKFRLYYRLFKGMKIHRPLDSITYNKASAIQTLKDKFGYEPYANKHFESVFTRFYEGYWLVKKFGFDKRRAHFSSLISTGQLSRDEALKKLENPPYDDFQAQKDLEYVSKKLGINKDAFLLMMREPNKTYQDYRNQASLIALGVKFAQILGKEKRLYR
jgi:N-acetyl sugar amidotransferase